MRRPRLNILRTFEAAGRRLSFSQAADELNISQAAVSQQMRQLEAHLGTPLFVRHHRRLSMTNTGQSYLLAVHEALDRLDTITDQLFPDRPYQVVTLRCTSSIAALWLAPHMAAFRNQHPDIDLRIRTLDQDYGNVKTTGAELEIVILNEPTSDPHTRQWLTTTILPVCSPRMFASHTRPQTPADILAFELIDIVGYDDDWHRWFRSFGLDTVAVPGGFSVDSSMIAMEAIQRGEGIMLGRRPFIDRLLRSGELVEVFSQPFHLHADYYLRQRPETKGQRLSKTVANWLVELAKKEWGENAATI